MHNLFLIVGRSASGKDSITNKLNEKGYKSVISYATRPKRENEGNTHIFIKLDDVQKYKEDMVAYTRIDYYEYFSTKQQLRNADLYIIDYCGVKYLREKLTPEDDIRLVTIYIYATPSECFERAMKRKDSFMIYENRIKAEAKQFAEIEKNVDFDYCIHNIDFNKTLSIVERIIEVENASN